MIEYFKLWFSKELTELVISAVIVVITIIAVIIAQHVNRKGKK